MSLPSVQLQAAPPRPGARIAISAVFFACGINTGAWATQIARLKIGFHLTDPGVAGVVLAFACGSIPTMPLAGALAARWGGPRAVAAGCAATALGLLLIGFAPSYGLLLAAAAAAGGAIGTLDVAMNGVATALSAASRRPVLSSIHGWFSLGGLAGAAGSGALTAAGLPVAGVLSCGAATMLLTAALAAPRLHVPRAAGPPAGPDAAPRRRGAGFAWPSSALWGIGAMTLLAFMTEGGIVDWATVYLHEAAGAPLAVAASGMAGFSLAMALGRFGGDRVVHRLGAGPVLAASGLGTAAGLAIALGFPAPAPAAAGFLLAGLGMANIVPLLFAAAGRVAGVPPAIGVAMAATMGYGAFLLGPPLIGFLAAATSLRAALLLLVGSSLGIAIGAHWRRAG